MSAKKLTKAVLEIVDRYNGSPVGRHDPVLCTENQYRLDVTMCAWRRAFEHVLETDHIGRNSSSYHVTLQLSTLHRALATKSGYSDPLCSALFYTLLPVSSTDLVLYFPLSLTLSFRHAVHFSLFPDHIMLRELGKRKIPWEQMDRESKRVGRSDIQLFF